MRKAGNLPEVSDIPRHKRRPPCQGNGGDEKIGAADLPELFVLKQAVEFGCGRRVEGKQWERGQVAVRCVRAVPEP